jgi:DNA polymerase III subunit delta'
MIKTVGHKSQRERLASILASGNIPHATLFSGPPGIGKRMIALSFIRALLCEGEKKPCGKCPSCAQVSALTHPDLVIIGPNENGVLPIGDGESTSEGGIRYLIHRLSIKPVSGRTGVVIDGIDCATTEAQNALLKTLEEPTPGCCIILIASDRSRLLPTIMSRVQEFRFAPLSPAELRTVLTDRPETGDLLDFIIAASGGSVSAALEMCGTDYREKVLSFCRAFTDAVSGGAPLSGIPASLLAKPKKGTDPLDIMIQIYRSLLEAKVSGNGSYSSLLDDIYIDDIHALRTIIKSLFAAKKGRGNNINIALHLKALAYYASQRSEQCAPPFSAGYAD